MWKGSYAEYPVEGGCFHLLLFELNISLHNLCFMTAFIDFLPAHAFINSHSLSLGVNVDDWILPEGVYV